MLLTPFSVGIVSVVITAIFHAAHLRYFEKAEQGS